MKVDRMAEKGTVVLQCHDGVVDSLSCIILDSAAEHLKKNDFNVIQSNNNFDG
ncbi:hypothetical protein MTR_3g064305 [Medicago truncatula]|uniref:Uncharacterized protein n=1 Tax=Medicago truncatula TaxID=3880 RepID=A0A072V8R4_MEDTR|nr:hypothetical protein MTR_3g064305 [Medicago truncatula]